MTAAGWKPLAMPQATPPRVRVTAPAALTLIAVGGVAVLALWWHDTLFISGWGDWLTNAGRLTGLACGYAIAVVLALMARIPALEYGIGADRLARWHGAAGRYLVGLAVAHTLLIIWGYAVSAHEGVLPETGSLLTAYPDVLMATVALGLLVVVGVVSARAARRRMRYETWHFVHLYTYLAVALAFAHEFATGADFVDVRARVLWAALYLAVGTLLVWYRLLVPLANHARSVLRVLAVVPQGPDIVSVIMGGRNLHRLRAEAGQFFRWRFLTRELWVAANPYSLSAAPNGETLRITVKTAGAHSAALARLRPGTRVLAEGPYGAFTGHEAYRSARGRVSGKVLLIGVGIGITPVRALFESIPSLPGGLTLLYRAGSPADVVLRDELDQIAEIRDARLHYLIGPRGDERSDPLSLRRLARLVPDLASHEVYLCGPDDLSATVVRTLRRAGVPRAAIHLESFAMLSTSPAPLPPTASSDADGPGGKDGPAGKDEPQ